MRNENMDLERCWTCPRNPFQHQGLETAKQYTTLDVIKRYCSLYNEVKDTCPYQQIDTKTFQQIQKAKPPPFFMKERLRYALHDKALPISQRKGTDTRSIKPRTKAS